MHRFASNLAVNGDMGWIPCSIRQKLEVLRLWNRLISVSNNRLVKKVFQWDKLLCRNNWCKEVKMICDEINMSDCFENSTNVDLQQAKEQLCRTTFLNWQSEITMVPKLRFYCLFKENYCTETFVRLIQNRKKRSICAQFRYSILPLSIETGRYQDIPIEYRFCIFCNDNMVESESHFLLHCAFYNNIRYELYNKVRELDFYFDLLCDEDKIRRLMKDDVIQETTNFLVAAFEKRQNDVYL